MLLSHQLPRHTISYDRGLLGLIFYRQLFSLARHLSRVGHYGARPYECSHSYHYPRSSCYNHPTLSRYHNLRAIRKFSLAPWLVQKWTYTMVLHYVVSHSFFPLWTPCSMWHGCYMQRHSNTQVRTFSDMVNNSSKCKSTVCVSLRISPFIYIF